MHRVFYFSFHFKRGKGFFAFSSLWFACYAQAVELYVSNRNCMHCIFDHFYSMFSCLVLEVCYLLAGKLCHYLNHVKSMHSTYFINVFFLLFKLEIHRQLISKNTFSIYFKFESIKWNSLWIKIFKLNAVMNALMHDEFSNSISAWVGNFGVIRFGCHRFRPFLYWIHSAITLFVFIFEVKHTIHIHIFF